MSKEKTMKKTIAAITIAMITMSGTAWSDNVFSDKARVISAKPIYETVRVNHPEERCWNEQVYRRDRGYSDSYTPSIAGAIVGGAGGNQFGKGSGKKVMTVAGALLGASVGRDISRSSDGRRYVTHERRCEVVDHYEEKEQLVGYRVKYKYNGQVFHTRTANDPGRWLEVRVSLQPTEGYAYNNY